MPKPSDVVCELCAGRGFTVQGDRPIDCECLRERRRMAAYDAIGIPKHLRSLDLTNFIVKQDAVGDDNMHEAQKLVARSLVYQWCDQVAECLRTGGEFVLDPTKAYAPEDGKDADGAEDAEKKKKAQMPQEVWRGSWVILRGERSSGKSLLATVMAKAAAAAGGYPKIFQWADIIESCYDFDRSSGNLYSRMSALFGRCSPIIIENVDAAYEIRGGFSTGPSLSPITKLRLDVMFSPINAEAKPVVFTTSRTTSEIETASKSVGPVLGSILESSAVIELPGRTNDFKMVVLNRGGGAK